MSITAERYSKALFELAQEKNDLEAVENSLSEIRKIMTDSKDFRLFLENPLLSYEEQSIALKAMFNGKIPALTYQFLIFITYKSRLNILKEMIESFDNMYLSHTHQMRVYVKTALPMNDEEKSFISQRLTDKFQQKIIARWILDPSLIGGFRIFAQGKLYDYSFKNQLDHFLQQTT